MKIVIAPDSFKESLTADEAARAIEAGLAEIWPAAQFVRVPQADGGEGTVAALVAATGGQIEYRQVSGPLGEPVEAFFGLSGDGQTAIIEMAAASGLALVPPGLRDPRLTTSYGTGELIRAALDAGARQLILGIGGSATHDGGVGMAQALGGRFLDAEGIELPPGGAALARLAHIDLGGFDTRLARCRIEVACDVTNPLIGPKGAAAIFAPQKGATPQMVPQLDAALAQLARIIKLDLGLQVAGIAGAGAGGGMGAGVIAFLGARLEPGISIVIRATGLEQALKGADLVITGEGRIDGQTVHGKTPAGVAQLARTHGIPVIGLAGSLGYDAGLVHGHGIDAIFGILPRTCTLPEALKEAAFNLQRSARNIAALYALGVASKSKELQ
jgi:glycerate kinase